MNLSTTGLHLAPDAAIDLPLHTTYSDGRWTLKELLDYLCQEKFGLAAVTDHDRADTAASIQQLAQEKNLPVLVAVEMSTAWQGELVDLLCFGFEPDQNSLCDLAQDLLYRQQKTTRKVYENLQQQGYILPSEAIQSILALPGLEQPHALVALLREHGFGLGEPSAGKLVVAAGYKYEVNEPAAIVEAAHLSGAVCLLAHPGRGNGFVNFDMALLDQFRQEAPVDGLEVYYPIHTPAKTEMYRKYAERHDLLISAGSDSHSPDKPPFHYQADLCRNLLERLGIQII
jgi:predicted metal-dependent phosphoesterase TrpH